MIETRRVGGTTGRGGSAGVDRRAASAARPIVLRGAMLFGALLLIAPNASLSDERGPQRATTVPELNALQQAFQGVVQRVTPSVVGIRAKRLYVAGVPGGQTSADARAAEQVVVVNGSGTIVRDDGSILTNEHVVQSASDIEVLFHDGGSASATIIASDPRSDLAILRVQRRGLPVVKLCDWSAVARGQWTVAIGNPYGLGGDGQLSVSVGVISNLSRRLPGLGEIDDRFYQDMIQTTAAINPGNSGGPLFNLAGELVGVVTAMHTRAAADEGIGFAIPITPAKRRRIEQLLDGRSAEYGYVGISVREPKPGEREASGVEPGAGAVIDTIEPDGPAAKADLREGDLIVRAKGQAIRSAAELVELVGEAAVGSQLELEARRGRSALRAAVTVDQRQVSRVAWMRGGALLWRGMRIANLTTESRAKMKVDAGATGVVVIDVLKGSAAEKAGLKIGDVIGRVGREGVGDIGGFRQRVQDSKRAVEVTLRNGEARTIAP